MSVPPTLTTPVVPGLFPRKTISYIVGSLDSGKTSFALNQLNDYVEGRGFMGYGIEPQEPSIDPAAQPDPKALTPPLQAGAIICCSSESDLRESLEKFPALQDTKRFPFAMIARLPEGERTLEADMEVLRTAYTQLTAEASGQSVRFLLLEGIQYLMSSGKHNDLRKSWEFCRAIREFCEERDITVIATIGMAKARRGEYYPVLGDRIYGSVAWAQAASTLIVLEDYDTEKRAEHRSQMRRVIIQTCQAATKVLYAGFSEEGRLELVEAILDREKKASPSFGALDRRLEDEIPGKVFTKNDILDWEIKVNDKLISERTIERWLSTISDPEMGFLLREGQGKNTTYRKPVPN